MKILIVDDEERMCKLIGGIVREAGWDQAVAQDGEAALEAVRNEKPDLVIMDVMLPRLDGFSVCRQLRSEGIEVPIIFLSAKGDIVDKGIGFQAGGDDYMTKPFDPRELLMHIEAHLRRANYFNTQRQPENGIVRAGRIELGEAHYTARKDGRELSLTPKEFRILLVLAKNPDTVVSKNQIVESAWGSEYVGANTSITVFIKKLREKVEDDPADPRIIQTVWGIGYRLNVDRENGGEAGGGAAGR